MSDRNDEPSLEILINATPVIFGGGITVAIQLVRAMARLAPHHHFIFFCTHSEIAAAEYPNNVELISLPELMHRGRRWVWEQRTLPGEAIRRKADVVFNFGGYSSFANRIPEVAVWQNPNVFMESTVSRPVREIVYSLVQRVIQYHSIRKAKHNIFLTEFSAASANKRWDLSRISHSAILSGINPARTNVSTPPSLAERAPLALTVGHAYFHKNYEALIDAMGVYRERYDHPLCVEIMGGVYVQKYSDQLEKRIIDQGLQDRIRFTGKATPEEVLEKMNQAKIYIVTSLLETFGLTMFEAMGTGLPVIASNASCHPEVCGDAVLYCDPGDPRDIADRLYELATDRDLQRKLQERGLERIKRYTWERSAEQYLKVIEDAAK